jgi:hypothetical protein
MISAAMVVYWLMPVPVIFGLIRTHQLDAAIDVSDTVFWPALRSAKHCRPLAGFYNWQWSVMAQLSGEIELVRAEFGVSEFELHEISIVLDAPSKDGSFRGEVVRLSDQPVNVTSELKLLKSVPSPRPYLRWPPILNFSND